MAPSRFALKTLERFAEAFAPCGFRREAFYPCYGLAEGTLLVSGKAQPGLSITNNISAKSLLRNRAVKTDDGDPDRRSLISCGSSLRDQEI